MSITAPQIFPDFPSAARLWIYPFPHTLTAEEQCTVKQTLGEFLNNWKSHGTPIKGGYKLLYDQFLVIVAEDPSAVSGCAIDESVRLLKQLKCESGLDALDLNKVYYRDANAIHATSRSEFRELADAGRIGSSTIIFDNTVTSLGEMRSGRWETVAAATWHAKLLGLS